MHDKAQCQFRREYLPAKVFLCLLHFLLQLRRCLAVLPVTIFLAIPVHLLTFAATVAIGAAATAKLAFLALELDTASAADISSCPQFSSCLDHCANMPLFVLNIVVFGHATFEENLRPEIHLYEIVLVQCACESID